MSFRCDRCGQICLSKIKYDRHILTCEHLSSIRDGTLRVDYTKTNVLPSKQEMFTMLQDALYRIEKMEEEITHLRRINQRMVRKVNIFEWLNSTGEPTTTLSKWIDRIDISLSNLFYIMNNGRENGIKNIVRSIIPYENIRQMPVRAFKHKPTRIFVYETNGTENNWIEKDAVELISIIRGIDRKVCGLFIKWKRENQERLEHDEEFREKVEIQQHELLGGKRDNQRLDHILTRYIFKHLEMNFKQKVDYEFI
jgi:hypothetical protein